jgi:hypothetical protein
MAIRGRKLTPDAVPVLKRKGQKTLQPRRGKINLAPKFSAFVARRNRSSVALLKGEAAAFLEILKHG